MGNNHDQEALKRQCMNKGMIIGMALFVPVGLLITILSDSSGLIGVGPAVGICVGVAIGEDLYRRKLEEYDHESD